jgi:hypothetical protein
MKYRVPLLVAFLFVVSGTFTAMSLCESDLPGRIEDLPPSEIEVITQLRTLGYVVVTEFT